MEEGPSQLPAQPARNKKWLLLVVAGVLAIIIVVAFLLARSNGTTSNNRGGQKQITGSKDFTMTTTGTPVTYAGHPVYDACGLVPFDVVRKNVKNYQASLDMNGTDKKPSEPLSIEHHYIDHAIPAALGQDAQPRPTAKEIGGQTGTSASSFISDADSNCWYGQGNDLSLGLGKVFAKVYVTQLPTPLSADLLAYLATLQKAGAEGNLAAYVESKTDSGNFFTGIVTNTTGGTTVFVKASTRELAQAMTEAASNTLAQTPKAPMNLTYPLAWSAMPNPCTLFSADDFQRATGKPASALADDVMTLNEVGGRIMQRSCERLEVERLDGSPISQSNITIRLASDETNAKKYVEAIKGDKNQYRIDALKQRIQLADDAYVKTVLKDGKSAGYELDMRIKNAIIVLTVDVEGKADASADAFASRMLPYAKAAADKYRAGTQR